MSMIFVRFRFEHPIFRAAVERVPDATVEWIRNVPAVDRTELLIWVATDDFAAFERALGADPTIAEVRQSVPVNDRRLLRVTLAEAGTDADLFPIIVETGSVIQEATVTADGWDCHFGFSDNAALSRFFEACRTRNIDYDIHRIYDPRSADDIEDGLTESQREALVTAMNMGYFDVPRRTGLQALGAELGISDTATSERIRRGMKTLVAQSLSGHVEEQSD